MVRRTVFGMLAGGVIALLSGCGLSGNPSYRFKMTVEVDTPEGLKAGSSVYEVETTGSSDLMYGGKGSRFTLRGEAVAVDLPGGRTLFALLKTVAMSGHDNLGVSSMVAMDPAFDYDWMASTKKIVSGDGVTSPAEVPAKYYPMLVMFKDIADPKSVELVDPKAIGVKQIKVEVTDEAVTTEIAKRLVSIGILPDRSLDNDFKMTTNPTVAQMLGYKDFVSGCLQPRINSGFSLATRSGRIRREARRRASRIAAIAKFHWQAGLPNQYSSPV